MFVKHRPHQSLLLCPRQPVPGPKRKFFPDPVSGRTAGMTWPLWPNSTCVAYLAPGIYSHDFLRFVLPLLKGDNFLVVPLQAFLFHGDHGRHTRCTP